MADTWTSTSDVTSRWVGDDKPDNNTLVERLIRDAEELIRFEYPDVPDRIVDPEEPPDPTPENPLPLERVQFVVSRMVIRHLRNPEGVRQATENAGPFSRNRTFAGDRPGQLWLTEDDRELLGYLPGAPSQKAFTVPQATADVGYLGGHDGVPW